MSEDLSQEEIEALLNSPLVPEEPTEKKEIAKADFQPLGITEDATASTLPVEMLLDVALEVVAELGRAEKPIREVLRLGKGSIVELDTQAGDSVNILVHGQRIAKGEVVVLDDRFAVRIVEVLNTPQAVPKLGDGSS